MPNKKNLKPQAHVLTVEEQSKGGKASVESKKKRKLLKDCMLDLLDLPVSNQKQWNKLARIGVSPEEIDNRSLLTVALFQQAVDCGDVSAFKEILKLIEEKGDSDEIKRLDEVLEKIEGNI